MVGMIANVQFFGGHAPENLGGQKRQNLARFRTTYEFQKCLRNQLRYQKSGTNLIQAHPWMFSKKLLYSNCKLVSFYI